MACLNEDTLMNYPALIEVINTMLLLPFEINSRCTASTPRFLNMSNSSVILLHFPKGSSGSPRIDRIIGKTASTNQLVCCYHMVPVPVPVGDSSPSPSPAPSYVLINSNPKQTSGATSHSAVVAIDVAHDRLVIHDPNVLVNDSKRGGDITCEREYFVLLLCLQMR